MSLKLKLVIIFLSISCVPIFFIGRIQYSNNENLVKSLVLEKLSTVASLKQSRAEDLLLIHDLTLLERTASNIELKSNLISFNSSKSSEARRNLINTLEDIRFKTENFKELLLFDTKGIVIASTDVNKVGSDYSKDPIFLKGMQNFNSIIFSSDASGLHQHLSGPVFSDREVIGILSVDYDPIDLVKIFDEYVGLGRSGDSILAVKDASKNTILVGLLRFNESSPSSNPFVSSQNLDSTTDAFIEGTDYKGTEVLALSKYVKSLDATLLVKIDKKEALSPLESFKDPFVAVSIIVIIFIVFISIYLSNQIATPIKNITAAVEEMAQGQLDLEIPVTSKDEVGKLAISFNELARKLRELYAEFERRVSEKTSQLTENVKYLEDSKKAILNILEDFQEEKNIAEKESARTQAMLESIGDGVVVIDENGKILLINEPAKELINISNVDPIGANYFDLFVATDEKGNVIPIEERPMEKTLKSGEKFVSSILYYIRSDKSRVPVATTVAPIFLGEKAFGVIAIFRDITKERDIDRMKTEFISLASHQLRTPLSAMKWFAEMLLEGDAGKLNKEQKEFINNINDSNERMIKLVDSLLNISRIESGRIVIEPVPTDINSLIEKCLKELKPQMDSKKIHFVFSANEDLSKAVVDPKLIGEVYSNLLSNSIKYTPEGGEISVIISKKDDEIISQISDTGYGIPKKDKDKIFEKFYRGENIVAVATDGNGLGLYLVKSIIESSGGRIWFESEEHKGTTFWFALPINGKTVHNKGN